MIYQPEFPTALQPAATAVLRELAASGFAHAYQGFQVLMRGEVLSAPSRLYVEPNDLRLVIARSSGDTDARTLTLSLATRHNNGYFREECLRQLLALDRPWGVPFIVQLLGEYVIEIVEVIASAIAETGAARFAEFALENPAFMTLTRQRATSYWDCYHRRRFPSLPTYPAIKALDMIERAVQITRASSMVDGPEQGPPSPA